MGVPNMIVRAWFEKMFLIAGSPGFYSFDYFRIWFYRNQMFDFWLWKGQWDYSSTVSREFCCRRVHFCCLRCCCSAGCRRRLHRPSGPDLIRPDPYSCCRIQMTFEEWVGHLVCAGMKWKNLHCGFTRDECWKLNWRPKKTIFSLVIFFSSSKLSCKWRFSIRKWPTNLNPDHLIAICIYYMITTVYMLKINCFYCRTCVHKHEKVF